MQERENEHAGAPGVGSAHPGSRKGRFREERERGGEQEGVCGKEEDIGRAGGGQSRHPARGRGDGVR